VLSHRTGLPNWRRSQPLRIYFTPGERFSYSGEGFAYLQKVVEHITGERADQFVEETVFKPLGMQNSSYVWQTRFEEQTAMPYGPSGAVTQKRKPTTPNVASTLQTTAPDYARFVVAILTGEGLKKETLHKMLSAQVKVDPNCVMCTDKPAGQLSETLAWGLGWGLEETKAGRAIWHWGDNDNFKGYVIAYPEQQTGAVYFANSFNGLALRDKLIEEAVGGKHPAFAWAKYDQFDSPKARIQEALEKAFADQGDDAGLSLYEKLRAEHPAEFKDETLLGNLGFALMNRKKPKKAAVVFELNAKAFPNSWMVYDSLGLIYMVQGRKEMAIRNYKKSLELNPANQRAQDTIKMLESQPGR
jgi:CubicO group peptidase (beta-lactamase class C family)